VSTLSIIALSVLAAIFGILILAAIAALVYAHLLLRRQISSFSLTIASVSGKLDSQLGEIEALIATIHGDRIEKAAQALIEIVPQIAKQASRNEQVCTAFQQALQALVREEGISGSDLDRAKQSGLLPDSYASASPGERYTSRSRVSEGDSIALAEEAADNSTTALGDTFGPPDN
jgi:hypothetical protein